MGGDEPEEIPAEYKHMWGRVTPESTIPSLKAFLEAGGTVLTIGSSTTLAYHLGLPLTDALREELEEGKTRPLSASKYFIPGSILRIRVDNTHPLAHGLPGEVDVFFNRNPVFRAAGSAPVTLHKVGWFDSDSPLRSGWALGQSYLENGWAVAAAEVGRGRLFLLGPEITFRAQPHGVFKFLFNGIFLGSPGAE
jgi:hypothetical protein